MSAAIVRFSQHEVAVSAGLLAVTLLAVGIVRFGPRSVSLAHGPLGWGLLSLVLVLDLARANTPWVRHFNYRERYASNPVIDRLRADPAPRPRVALLRPSDPALDRLRRAVEGQIDSAYQLLQPKAEALGKAFNADEWVVKLFSEEVVRGQSVFLLSMLIHHFDPVLRKQAKLGDWQVISPSSAVGEVQFVESFRTVQGQRFERPTIIVAEKVFVSMMSAPASRKRRWMSQIVAACVSE